MSLLRCTLGGKAIGEMASTATFFDEGNAMSRMRAVEQLLDGTTNDAISRLRDGIRRLTQDRASLAAECEAQRAELRECKAELERLRVVLKSTEQRLSVANEIIDRRR